MPHPRSRYVLQKLKKKLSFHPVVAVQGARQTGKSFLCRELLPPELPRTKYRTFDDEATRSAAHGSPSSFLLEYPEARPLVVDEAQKVPSLFDAAKFEVDRKRTPARFLLLGSTEFSILAQIRESLTGRMGRIRLYPLTVREALGNPRGKGEVTRADFLRHLKMGGLPGIFAVREEEEFNSLFQDWVDLVCYRDLQQFKSLRLDGELAFQILRQCALQPEPTQAAIAKMLRKDPRRVGTHLRALAELFVLQRLDPHPSGTGKSIFLPFDAGLAHFLGASLERKVHVLLLNEMLASNSYFSEKRASFYFYRSTGKHLIHLVHETPEGKLHAVQIGEREKLQKTDMELMRAFLVKNPGAKGELAVPIHDDVKISGISCKSWESFLL